MFDQPDTVRRLGCIALGALLSSTPAVAAGRTRPLSGIQQFQSRQAGHRTLAAATEPVSPAFLPEPLPTATLTVTTAADVVDPGDGKLSLREAVAEANTAPGTDAIEFASALEGKTLVLSGGELVLSKSAVISGAGRDITLSGSGKQRILRISGGNTSVALKDLTLTAGYAEELDGGAVFMGGGSLSVSGCTVSDSRASGPVYSAPRSGGGIFAASGSRLTIADSTISGNSASVGGGIGLHSAKALISRSSITNNTADDGGAIWSDGSLTIYNSTIASNYINYGDEGNIRAFNLVVRNSTITGNRFLYAADAAYCSAGITADNLYIYNSIVAGNAQSSYDCPTPDLHTGAFLFSNGHNVFGSKVKNSIAGDHQSAAPASIFATIDQHTGGGKLDARGIVPLKSSLTNPALSGADPITASSFGQLGTTPRPQPAGSLPDIGAIEIDQKLSTSPTANNDVIIGNNAANNLSGLAGNDYLKGLGGDDMLSGGDGSDVLDGGPGNDVLNGGNGVDIASFAGTTAVVIDLSTNPATAKRGSETDTLTSIEGAIGSDKADSFKGDGQNNEFQGGLGKDSYTGGGGRDLYAFKTAQDSPAGAGRDVIKDFVPGQDVIDVSDLDADSTTPGQQSFRWVGKATLTGAAQLGYYVSGGNTIVRASIDADAAAEIEIQLTGKKTLTEADFRF